MSDSTKIDDGGPIYPEQGKYMGGLSGGLLPHLGLSLRDAIAIETMKMHFNQFINNEGYYGQNTKGALGKFCYEMADEMLKVRSQS